MNSQVVIADIVEAFIRSEFDVSPSDNSFDRTVDLFELGYVDSVGFAELLEFLAEEFAVEIPEDDLLSETFTRIDGIAAIVSRLVAGNRQQGALPEGQPAQ
jgi:D-alanine--poly(phosphoribitol) ligase subunit 2